MYSFLEVIIIIVIALTILPFFSLAPFAPTKSKDLKRLHKLLKLKPKEKFLEIGCGTGKVSMYLAKHNRQAQIVGIEFSFGFFLWAEFCSYFKGLNNLELIYGNALNHDYSTYDAIYIFGMGKALEKKILPKLEKEMKKKGRVFSYCFRIENWKGKEVKHKEKQTELAIYEYKK